MSAPAPDPSPTAADAGIHRLARELVTLHRDDELPSSLLRLRPGDAGDTEMGLFPLAGDHPASYLTGHVADPDVDALGVVTGGRVFHLDDPAATLGRTSIATVVSRRGEVAGCSVGLDGELRDDGAGLSGIVVDLLHRALGLPTAPAPCEPNVIIAGHWLTEITLFVEAEERVPCWKEITELHPAVRMLRSTPEGLPNDVGLERCATALGNVVTWRLLRDQLDDGVLSLPGLQPGDGAWYDDGAFARRLLADRTPLRHVRSEVRSRLPARLWQRVADTLAACGVPETCWPDPLEALDETA